MEDAQTEPGGVTIRGGEIVHVENHLSLAFRARFGGQLRPHFATESRTQPQSPPPAGIILLCFQE